MEKDTANLSKRPKIDRGTSSGLSPEIINLTTKVLSPKELRLDKLLHKIKTSTLESGCSALVEIRTKIINVSGGVELFKRRGGIKVLVSVIQKAHKKSVDVALSILGNCGLEEESRTHFRRWGGIPPLVNTLQVFTEDSILSRASRAIGNLAKEPKSAAEFHECKTAYFLSGILLSSENNDTQRMVMRALQNLGDTKEHCVEVGRALGLSNLWKVIHKSEDEETLKMALKTVSYFVKKCPMSDEWGRMLVAGDDGGKGIARLVDLTQHSGTSLSHQALKLLPELVEKPEVRLWLVNPYSLEKLVQVVDQGTPKQTGWSTYLGALCLLGRENTVHFRQAGGIPLLVRLLYQTGFPNYDPNKWLALQRRVFNTLLAFEHDHPSLELLLEANIIPYLKTQLDNYVNPKSESTSVEEKIIEVRTKSLDTSTEDNPKNEASDALNDDGPRFRISSPSYHAVQQEVGELISQSQTSENEPLNIFDAGRWSWSLGLDNPSSPNLSHSSLSDSESVTSSTSFLSPSDSDGHVSPSHSESDWSEWSSESGGVASPPIHFSPLRSSSADNEDLESHYFSSVDEEEEPLREKSIFAIDTPLAPSKARSSVSAQAVNHLCLGPDLTSTFNICLMNVHEQHYCVSWPQYEADSTAVAHLSNQAEREQADWALCLLNHLSWLAPFPPQLHHAKLVPLLLKYLSTKPVPNPRAAKLLARLATCPKYFAQMVAQNEVPLIVSSLHVPDSHCCSLATSLRDLQMGLQKGWQVLTSTFGRGEILYLLQKGTSDERLAAALATPFLVTSATLLHHIMVKKNALKLLFDSLSESPPPFLFAAFRELGQRLNFKRFLLPITESTFPTSSPCQLLHSSQETDITFEFDDTNQVHMRRSVLSASPVLAAMFGPHFMEANQSVIRLHAINSSSFQHFYHFLAGCTHVYRDAHVEELVEMWQLADRYLVSSEKVLWGLAQKASAKAGNFARFFAYTASAHFTEEGESLSRHLLAYYTLNDWSSSEKASILCDTHLEEETESPACAMFGNQWRTFLENELHTNR